MRTVEERTQGERAGKSTVVPATTFLILRSERQRASKDALGWCSHESLSHLVVGVRPAVVPPPVTPGEPEGQGKGVQVAKVAAV